MNQSAFKIGFQLYLDSLTKNLFSKKSNIFDKNTLVSGMFENAFYAKI